MHWLRSHHVLPLIREWFDTILHQDDLYSKLLLLLDETCHPYSDQVSDIAHLALTHQLRTPSNLGIAHQEILVKCGQFAFRLGRANKMFFHVDFYKYSTQTACSDAAFLLLFAFEDYIHNPDGVFFGVLLQSELAWMVRLAIREHWERHYAFEGEEWEGEEPEDLNDQNEQDAGFVLPLRGKPPWKEIVDYEGLEGRQVDFDEVSEEEQEV